jgi:thiamine-phosphate pyrophosphorylase
MRDPRCHGLYVVTDAGLARAVGLVPMVAEAIEGGARLVQYRDKGRDACRRRNEAEALAALCRRHGVQLIVNDDVELAAEVGADGVHLGRDDPAIETARRRLGEAALIGVSCYDRFELALAARAAGADYVAFGSFFPSATKPHAVRADAGLLSRARSELGLPVVAIGGITPENGAALIAAGADMLAVVNAVFAAADVRAAAASLARLFPN